jgi:hypothetical protein
MSTYSPIRYYIRAAAKAFNPPLSEKRLRMLIRAAGVTVHAFGKRGYVLHNELVALAQSLPST